jgi:hypothetical protein
MAVAATVDVAEVLETRKVGTFQLGIWFLAFLMLFMDGFDLSGALVGAPALSAVLIYSLAAIGCASLPSCISCSIGGALRPALSPKHLDHQSIRQP